MRPSNSRSWTVRRGLRDALRTWIGPAALIVALPVLAGGCRTVKETYAATFLAGDTITYDQYLAMDQDAMPPPTVDDVVRACGEPASVYDVNGVRRRLDYHAFSLDGTLKRAEFRFDRDERLVDKNLWWDRGVARPGDDAATHRTLREPAPERTDSTARMLAISAFGAAAVMAAAFAPGARPHADPAGEGLGPVVGGGGDAPASLALVEDAPAAAPQDGARDGADDSGRASPETVAPAPDVGPRWMVGDLHVHASPPDEPGHSTLTVGGAIDAARRGGLDFVFLTPHAAHVSIPPSAETGDAPLYGQELVVKRAAEHLTKPKAPDAPEWADRRVVVVAGWEWTRESPGHLGVAFVDVGELSGFEGDAKAERALGLGGLVVVNHPYFRPVPSDLAVMKLVRGDRRWRPFFGDGGDAGLWNAIEVWHDRSVWIERLHAKSADRFPDTQMVTQALASWDAATLTFRRRIAGVGGSDAHGRLPYTVAPMPMVSVLVDSPDLEGLRRGLLGARVTFGRDGGVAARTFRATSDVPGERAVIGGDLRARREVHLTWEGSARLVENGMDVGTFYGGTTRPLPTENGFAFWRIEMDGEAFSNMIYANLP